MNWLKTLMPLILVDSIKSDYDANSNEIEGKISSTTDSATTFAFKAVEKKTPNDQTQKTTKRLLILIIKNIQMIYLTQK